MMLGSSSIYDIAGGLRTFIFANFAMHSLSAKIFSPKFVVELPCTCGRGQSKSAIAGGKFAGLAYATYS